MPLCRGFEGQGSLFHSNDEECDPCSKKLWKLRRMRATLINPFMRFKKLLIWIFSILGFYLAVFSWTSSSVRFYSEHGVELPDSSRGLSCFGNAYSRLPDRGATSYFEMREHHFELFEKSFLNRMYFHAVEKFVSDPLKPPDNAWSDGRAFWAPGGREFTQKQPFIRFSAKSSTGDVAFVETYKGAANDFILVKVSTDWN